RGRGGRGGSRWTRSDRRTRPQPRRIHRSQQHRAADCSAGGAAPGDLRRRHAHAEERMTDSKRDLLNQLVQDEVEYLWVVFHDYSGRACAKTAPRPSMEGVVESGVVFAKANLNMDYTDHQVRGGNMLADSGDFMAVPDPRSYCLMPRYPGTAL